MIRSQALIDRYLRTETEQDALGRTFTVGLLKPSARNALYEMLGGNPDLTILNFMRCASVRSVVDAEGTAITFGFPKDREELLNNMDLFDSEGIEAITRAMIRLDPPKTEKPKNVVEDAKN